MKQLFALCLLLTGLPSAAQATMRYFDAEYRIYAAGILFARVEVHLEFDADTYRLSAHIAPAALGRLAANTHAIATTYGRLQDGGFQPERLDLNWVRDDEVKGSFMRYRKGEPIEFVSGYKPQAEQLPLVPVKLSEVGHGTVDPFTAMLLLLKKAPLVDGCTKDIEIFDGRRRASLQLTDPTIVPKAAHDYPARLTALSCTILWTPIAGYSKAALERAADFPPVETHYSRISDSDLAAPQEMRGRSRYGSISIYAVRFFTERAAPRRRFNIRDFLPENERKTDRN